MNENPPGFPVAEHAWNGLDDTIGYYPIHKRKNQRELHELGESTNKQDCFESEFAVLEVKIEALADEMAFVKALLCQSVSKSEYRQS